MSQHISPKTRLAVKLCLIFFLGLTVSFILLLILTHGSLTSSYDASGLIVKGTVSSILLSVLVADLVAFAVVAVVIVCTVRSLPSEVPEKKRVMIADL